MIKINKDLSEIPKSLQEGKSYTSEDIKKDLAKFHNYKCYYCETANIKGEVEHFRPKAKTEYPWLINDWQNLLWACHDCNNIKGVKLPVAKKIAIEPDNVNVCDEKEELIMFNPEYINPEKFIEFDKTGKISSENKQMKKTIEICKLDRENLNDVRKTIYDDLDILIASIKNLPDNQFRNILKENFIKPINQNKKLDFTVFRKYIIKNWLTDMLS